MAKSLQLTYQHSMEVLHLPTNFPRELPVDLWQDDQT